MLLISSPLACSRVLEILLCTTVLYYMLGGLRDRVQTAETSTSYTCRFPWIHEGVCPVCELGKYFNRLSWLMLF